MTPESADNDRPSGPADASETVEPQAQPARHRRTLVLVAVAVVVLGLDILSKALVVAHIRYGDSVRLLDGAIYLVQTRNAGAAFAVGTGFTVVLTVLALAVAAVIVRQARRLYSIGWAISLGLILGGALGNLADRLFRAPGVGRGYVVDWISLFSSDGHIWPIFNAADSSIVCGAILAGVLSLLGISIDGRRSVARTGNAARTSNQRAEGGSRTDSSGSAVPPIAGSQP